MIGPKPVYVGAGFSGAASETPAPTANPDTPRAAANAAPATRFTYIPVSPFRA